MPTASAIYRATIALIEVAQEEKKSSGKIFVVYETKDGEDVYHGFNRGAAREAYHYRGPDHARMEVIRDAGTDNFDDDTVAS